MDKYDAFEVFCRDVSDSYSQSVLKHTFPDLKNFLAYCPQQNIEDIGKKNIREWLSWLQTTKSYKPGTLNTKLSSVKRLMNYCAEENIIIVNPVLTLKRFKTEKNLPRPIDRKRYLG